MFNVSLTVLGDLTIYGGGALTLTSLAAFAVSLTWIVTKACYQQPRPNANPNNNDLPVEPVNPPVVEPVNPPEIMGNSSESIQLRSRYKPIRSRYETSKLGNTIHIDVVRSELQAMPLYHLGQLDNLIRERMQCPESIDVTFLNDLGEPEAAIDAGGPSREYFECLFEAIMRTPKLKFLRTSHSLLIPQFNTNLEEEILIYQQMGRVMALCGSITSLKTGKHFDPSVFQVLNYLYDDELNGPATSLKLNRLIQFCLIQWEARYFGESKMWTLFDELSKHLFPSSDSPPEHEWSIIKQEIDQARKCRPDLIKLLKCKNSVLESLCKPGTVSEMSAAVRQMSDNLKRLLPQINQNAGAQHIREQLIANYFIPDFSLIHALAQGLFERIKVWKLDTSLSSMFSRQCKTRNQLKKDKIVPILSSLRLSETAEAQKNNCTRLNKILLKPEHLNIAKNIHLHSFSAVIQGNIFIRFLDETNLEQGVQKSINTIISQMEKSNIISSLVEKLENKDLLEVLDKKGITTTNESAKILSIANTLIEKIELISSNIDRAI